MKGRLVKKKSGAKVIGKGKLVKKKPIKLRLKKKTQPRKNPRARYAQLKALKRQLT